jgi:tRNA threonylcarbamoyladenosine dehydratase
MNMFPEWQSRTELLIGEYGLHILSNSHVLIAGLGGVGGWAAEHLVRTGIGEITLIDSDTITESNINRQIIALHSTIGQSKVDAISNRLLDINPKLKIHTSQIFLKADRLTNQLSESRFDFVLDCIDTLSPKINLILSCLDQNIPFVSSLGSGAKTDPTKIHIADISKSYNCNLGRMLRKRLHKLDIYTGFKVVFSTEKADKNAIITEESLHKKSNTGTISYIPAIFGSMMAGYCITELLKS